MKIEEVTLESPYFEKIVSMLENIDREHEKKVDRREVMRKRCMSFSEKCFVATIKGKAVGTISLFRDSETSEKNELKIDMYLGSLFVEDSFRGRGIARKLIEKINTPCYALTKITSECFGVLVKTIEYNHQIYNLYFKG